MKNLLYILFCFLQLSFFSMQKNSMQKNSMQKNKNYNLSIFCKKFNDLNLDTINNKDKSNIEKLRQCATSEKYIFLLCNTGASFGINSVLDNISAMLLNEYINKNNNFKNFFLVSAGKGGFNEFIICENKKKNLNITYNDTTDVFLNDFKERTNIKKINTLIGNMFELDKIINNKLQDFILISNSLHFYSKRNINSNYNQDLKQFILNNIYNCLNKEKSHLSIITNNIFNIYLNENNIKGTEAINEITNKYVSKIDIKKNFKESFFEDSILKIEKLMKSNKINFIEAKNIYLNNYKLSEEINNENNFREFTLFPHDLFDMSLNEIEELKNKYYKIKINFINTSNFEFIKTIYLNDHVDNHLLKLNLSENPLTVILNSFNSMDDLKEFLIEKSTLDFFSHLKKQKIFGMKIDFSINKKKGKKNEKATEEELILFNKILTDSINEIINDDKLIYFLSK